MYKVVFEVGNNSSRFWGREVWVMGIGVIWVLLSYEIVGIEVLIIKV